MRKELSATAITTLYLVADEHRSVLLASCLQALGKLFGSHAYAADTLYALDDAGCHIALGKLSLPCGEVVERKERNVVVGIDWRNNLRIVGSLNRKRCTTVKRFLGREHTCLARMERRKLQGILVGLGSRVDKE